MADPETIADEYLRPGEDLRIQKNALTLLRVVGGATSAGRLAREAVENANAEVRRCAGMELRALEGDADRQHAVETLKKVLASSQDDLQRVRAYALLGDLGVVTASLPDRLRLVTKLHRAVYPDRNVTFYSRAVLPSLLGAGLAALLLLVYVSHFGLLRDDAGNVLGTVLLYAVPAALLAPVLVTHRSVAFGLYPGFLTGLVVECLTIVVIMMPLSLLGYVVAFILSSPRFGFEPFVFTAGVLTSGLMAVRLGTVLAYPASGDARANFLIQAAAGGSLGASVLIGSLLLRPGAGLAGYWISLTALMFGLAAAFAWIDVGATGVKPRPGQPFAKLLAGAAMAGLGALLALPFNEIGPTQIEVGPKPRSMEIPQLPRTLRLSLSVKSEVLFELTSTPAEDSNDDIDTVIELVGMNQQPVRTFDGPESFEEILESGVYTITVDQYSRESVSQETVFAKLFGAGGSVLSPNLVATFKGVPVKRETYRASGSVQAVDQTPVSQVPFLRFIHPPRDASGIRVALLGQDPEKPLYEFALYKGAKEVLEFDDEAGHHEFQSGDTGGYVVVVKKERAKFVLDAPNGDAVLDTVPIENGLILYTGVLTPTPYRPAGPSVTTLGREAAETDVPVTGLPFVQFLRVTAGGRQVVIDLPATNQHEDLALTLFGETGGRIASADDPETITQSLSAGLYWVVVGPYSERRAAVTMNAGEIVLTAAPVPPGLVLKIR